MNRASTTTLAGLAIAILCACTFGESVSSSLATQSAATGIASSTAQPVLRMTLTLVSNAILCATSNEDARQAYNDAGTAEDSGDFAGAEKFYLKAIELDPNYCDAMDNLGVMLRRQGRIDEAISWYKKSLAVRPDNTLALQNLAVAYTLLGQNDDAIATYEQLVKIAPDSGEGYYGLGIVYYGQKQYDKALVYFKQAETIYRQTGSDYLPDAQHVIGLTYFQLNDCANTEKYLEPLYSEKDPDINYDLGVCLATTEPKDLDLARKYLDQAQALGMTIPDDVLKALNGGS